MQALLADAGVCSRRHAEDLIRQGRVQINGEVAALGQKAGPEDDLRLDGRPVLAVQEKVCYLLNKPAGVVTTLSDPQGRPSVAQFVAQLSKRVYPIGRLDRDSEGMLLLTNDGALANGLMHPRYHVPKTYLVSLDGPVDDAFMQRLLRGVALDDGPVHFLRVERLAPEAGMPRLRLVIAEGRKRVVRRAVYAAGRQVVRLVRVAVGPLALGDLPPGALRRLSENEVEALRQAVAAAQESGS
ncbi:MAG: pseudouridine synthase [Thermaerobacter sp.]|nr:pseudouridine synthase [Thermaerobacter sp.]